MAIMNGNQPQLHPHHSDTYINRIWSSQTQEATNAPSLDGNKPSYLPTLVTKSYSRGKHLLADADQSSTVSDANDHAMTITGASRSHREFRTRVRPSIFKGKTHSVAVDPESHIQLEREKQAMYEHRLRPKTPVSLEPVQVSLSRPKSKKPKVKAKRLSRSAPDMVQVRNPKQGLPYYQPKCPWKSENHLQLPLLSGSSLSALGDLVLTTSATSTTSTTSHSSLNSRSTNTSRSLTSNSKPLAASQLTNMSNHTHRGSTSPDKSVSPSKAMKPLIQAFKLSQNNYAASRMQRLLDRKQRSHENTALSVRAQSYSRQELDSILNTVEESQHRVCSKHDGRRNCGICPNTAKSRRDETSDFPQIVNEEDDLRIDSELVSHLAVLQGNKDGAADGERKELIVQLPNMTYSRANTPGAAALTERAAAMHTTGVTLPTGTPEMALAAGRQKVRRTTNTPADGFYIDGENLDGEVHV